MRRDAPSPGVSEREGVFAKIPPLPPVREGPVNPILERAQDTQGKVINKIDSGRKTNDCFMR